MSEGFRPFIREVILEDFMSHEYSRIKLAPGLNIVLGPNGAGKSSILLAISLAMGQSHTERSRKLSELVRYGREQARVTLLLDNGERDGRRPLPRRSDVIRLSRVVRSTGDYWFEIDYRRADRLEVVDMLRELGLNPDNLLIIMHQGLVDEFTALTPQDRLVLVEEATGISGYRRRLERAMERLEGVKAEEKEKEKQLEQLRAMEDQWRRLYEKLEERRGIEDQLRAARAELAWARVSRLEESVGRLEERRRGLEADAEGARRLAAAVGEELARLRRELEAAVGAGDRDRIFKVVDDIAYDSAERALAEYRAKLAEEEARRITREEAKYEEELRAAREEAKGERPSEVRDPGEVEDEVRVLEAKAKALGDLPGDGGGILPRREVEAGGRGRAVEGAGAQQGAAGRGDREEDGRLEEGARGPGEGRELQVLGSPVRRGGRGIRQGHLWSVAVGGRAGGIRGVQGRGAGAARSVQAERGGEERRRDSVPSGAPGKDHIPLQGGRRVRRPHGSIHEGDVLQGPPRDVQGGEGRPVPGDNPGLSELRGQRCALRGGAEDGGCLCCR
ncbi:MAG: AAA family ATPase [Nitrososphaeria archaeon]